MRSAYEQCEQVEYNQGTANPTPLVQALKMMYPGTVCESRSTRKKIPTKAEKIRNRPISGPESETDESPRLGVSTGSG